MDVSKFQSVLKPKYGFFNIDFKELAKYKDLTFLFVKRDFVSKYKQTILGPAWAVIQPLLTSVIFTLVFGGIAGLAPGGVPSFVFYLLGNVIWGYFSLTVSTISFTFISNAPIFGKVYFPRLVLPISTALTNMITMAIQFSFFLIFWVYYLVGGNYPAMQPNIYLILVPFLIIQAALLAIGVGIIVSALTTKYRDLNMLVGFGVQLWMYATPVAYSMQSIAEKGAAFAQFKQIIMYNPMTPIMETIRFAFLGEGAAQPCFPYLYLSIGVTLVILFIGVLMFSRVEKTFMDTV